MTIQTQQKYFLKTISKPDNNSGVITWKKKSKPPSPFRRGRLKISGDLLGLIFDNKEGQNIFSLVKNFKSVSNNCGLHHNKSMPTQFTASVFFRKFQTLKRVNSHNYSGNLQRICMKFLVWRLRTNILCFTSIGDVFVKVGYSHILMRVHIHRSNTRIVVYIETHKT